MSSYGLSDFGSPLDSLVFDTIVDTEQTERDAAEELALWVHYYLFLITIINSILCFFIY